MTDILVIDDEPAIVAVLRHILEGAGYQVLVAPDGKAAVAVYDSHPVDLVITDILMPEQEGLETIRQLRSRSSTLKIIAMSGGGRYGLAEFLKVAKMLGADSTLYKPFTQQEVLDTVHRLLEG